MKITLLFLDGTTREVELCRPPRYVLWRHGRSAKVFLHRVNEITAAAKGEEGEKPDNEEQGMMLLESMSEPEAIKFQAFADDVVRLSTKPQVQVSELSELSYWSVFGHVFFSRPDTPVETEEGETDIKAVENFPAEPELSPDGAYVPNLPAVGVSENGDSLPASG